MTGPDSNAATLFAAVQSGDVEAVRSLLAAEPSLVNAQGSVAHWSGECTPLQIAVEQGHREMIRALLDHGADINEKAGLTGWAPLHLALKNRDVAQDLIDRGALVDIHAASGLGDLATVKNTVERHPEAVGWPGPDGATPLHFAATVEVAGFLLDRGAAIDACDQEHKLPPLAWLASNRPVAAFLMTRGASVDNPFLAAAVGDVDRLRSLLDADADLLYATTPEGDFYGTGATLLHVAVANGRREAVSVLLDRGADVDAKGGWWNVTPLHWAAQHGWTDIAQVLLDRGADVSARDSEHYATPLSWAEFFERKEMVDLLSRGRQA